MVCRVSHKRLVTGERSPHLVGGESKIKMDNLARGGTGGNRTLDKYGNQVYGTHLMDLISTSISNKSWRCSWKSPYVKYCFFLKAIRISFFPICTSWSGEGQGRHEWMEPQWFGGGKEEWAKHLTEGVDIGKFGHDEGGPKLFQHSCNSFHYST